jgi:hypothetical protein
MRVLPSMFRLLRDSCFDQRARERPVGERFETSVGVIRIDPGGGSTVQGPFAGT